MPRLLRTQAALEAEIPALLGARRIALDTEFHTERHFLPRLMLLQLCADDGEPLLADPLAPLDLSVLAPVFRDVPLLVHGGQADLQIVYRLTGAVPRDVFDTQIAAGCVGQGFPLRLQELTRRNLGIHLDKTETLSDWSLRPLSAQQVHYAGEDVRVLGSLVDALRQKLEARGNVAVAAGLNAAAVADATTPEDIHQAWRRIPGAHTCDGPDRAALRRLAAWREDAARLRDQPRHNVLGDALLLDLARRRPSTLDGMRANRRMPGQVVKRDGDRLLQLLSTAAGDPPPPPLQPRSAAWVEVVRAAARVAERHTGVAPELSLAVNTLQRLAQGTELEPWRRQALGDWFFRFVAGEATLSVADVGDC